MDPTIAHLTSWAEPARGDVPLPLTGPSVTMSPIAGPPTVFVFGGKVVSLRRLTSEMWAFDIATRTWTRVDAGDGPGPRYFHSMDTWEDKLVCFGGMSDYEILAVHNDIWFFDCRARRWLPQPSPTTSQDPALLPQSRYAHLSAVSRGQLVISGGQHSDNSWIYEVNVYDLRRRQWIAKTDQPEAGGLHSKGAYRSVAASSKQRVIVPESLNVHSYSIDEDGEGGDIWCYSNYDFAKVRRELEVMTPMPAVAPPSDRYRSPPTHAIRDESPSMRGSPQPPGLRFPTGGIVGRHFILCGLYLASSSAAFSIWALDLVTLTWRHLQPQVLSSGSWNRAVLWPEQAKLLVFGNSQSDLATDYGKRAVNLDHIAVISLETYGIYRPPILEVPAKVQDTGIAMLDEKLASDFDVVSEDGKRVKCSRQILQDRWPWFAEQLSLLADKAAGIVREAPAVDINDTLLGSFTPARLTPTQLSLAEPFPVCVGLVQYFYTLSLSTPLQNRAPVLSALLFLAKQYKIDRLAKLVTHALHARLDSTTALGIYEIATLAGEQNLQARALNLIHSSKGGPGVRSHRQGSGTSHVNDSIGSTANMATTLGSFPVPPSQTPEPSSDHQSSQSEPHDAPYRRARADSLTVPTEVLTATPLPEPQTRSQQLHASHIPPEAGVNQLLAALDINSPVSEIDNIPASASASVNASPRVPPTTPPVPSRARRPPPLMAPPEVPLPVPRLDSSFHLGSHRPSSPTISEVTSGCLRTPAESIRESAIFPRDSIPNFHADSRPSPLINVNSSKQPGHGIGLPSLPEFGDTDFKANDITFESFKASMPITLARSSSFTSSPDKLLHRPSVASTSTTSSGGSELSIGTYAGIAAYLMPESGALARANTQSSITDPSDRSLMRSDTTSSGSTGAFSSTFSKKTEKAERKAIAAAEKAQRKAETQAKFEALRAEQMLKIAKSKAEAQRKAEIASKEALVVKKGPAPQSKLGKFGAKFAEVVLFPAGGDNSTMF